MSAYDDFAAELLSCAAEVNDTMAACLGTLSLVDTAASNVQSALESDSDPRAVAIYNAAAALRGFQTNAYNAINSYNTAPDMSGL